jgi:3-oxoadipate enol-lactonase
MPRVEVGDISLHYEIHGDGEPLLLIMGFGANSSWWLPQIPALSREYQVVTFDNRGTGGSDKPDIPYTMPMLVADAAGLLAAIGVDSANVFGVSMGGMIAQGLALSHPEKVISLILGCTTPGGPNSIPPTPEATRVLFDGSRRQRLTLAEQTEELLPFLYSQDFIDNNPEFVAELTAEMAENPTPNHAFRRQGEATMHFNVYDRLPEINAPTLVISGTADRIVPMENSRILASRIPGAELALLGNMGHGFVAEAHEETSQAVLGFLNRHRRSRKPAG